MPPPCEAAGIPPFDSTSGIVPNWTGAGSACTCSPPGGPSVSPMLKTNTAADRRLRFRRKTCKGEKIGLTPLATLHTATGPEQQSQYTCRQPHSETYRGGKLTAKLFPGRQLGTTFLFRRRGNAPAAGELLSCPAAARRSSPIQLPEREWAHRGLRQRGSSRQRPGAVQRAWRLRSRCHQPRHLQVQRALEGPLLRLCGVPFVWVRCRPR